MLPRDSEYVLLISHFEVTNSEKVWQYPMNNGSSSSFSLLELNGIVVVGQAGEVFAFNIDTGNLIWKGDLRGYGYDITILLKIVANYYSVGPTSLAAYTRNDGSSIVFAGNAGMRLSLFITMSNLKLGNLLSLDGQTGALRHEAKLETAGAYPIAMWGDSAADRLFAGVNILNSYFRNLMVIYSHIK